MTKALQRLSPAKLTSGTLFEAWYTDFENSLLKVEALPLLFLEPHATQPRMKAVSRILMACLKDAVADHPTAKVAIDMLRKPSVAYNNICSALAPHGPHEQAHEQKLLMTTQQMQGEPNSADGK